MIGIDVKDKRGIVAVFREQQPAILGEGKSMEELVGIARVNLGEPGLATTAAIAVPAWFNDEQRKSVVERGKDAGLTKMQLINLRTPRERLFGVARRRSGRDLSSGFLRSGEFSDGHSPAECGRPRPQQLQPLPRYVE